MQLSKIYEVEVLSKWGPKAMKGRGPAEPSKVRDGTWDRLQGRGQDLSIVFLPLAKSFPASLRTGHQDDR